MIRAFDEPGVGLGEVRQKPTHCASIRDRDAHNCCLAGTH
jgi:hypothetical protein